MQTSWTPPFLGGENVSEGMGSIKDQRSEVHSGAPDQICSRWNTHVGDPNISETAGHTFRHLLDVMSEKNIVKGVKVCVCVFYLYPFLHMVYSVFISIAVQV